MNSKTRLCVLFISLLIVLIFAGLIEYSAHGDERENSYVCGGYYPFSEGFKWNYSFTIYSGEESVVYDLNVINESTGTLSGGPTLTQAIKLEEVKNQGKVLAKYPRILWLKDDELVEIPQRNKERSSLKKILPCPPVKGSSWTNRDEIDFAFFDDNKSVALKLKYRIELDYEVISLPAGEYRSTIKVVVHGEKTVRRNQSRFTVTFDEQTWYGTETGLLKETLIKKVLGKKNGASDRKIYWEKKELVLENLEKPKRANKYS